VQKDISLGSVTSHENESLYQRPCGKRIRVKKSLFEHAVFWDLQRNRPRKRVALVVGDHSWTNGMSWGMEKCPSRVGVVSSAWAGHVEDQLKAARRSEYHVEKTGA